MKSETDLHWSRRASSVEDDAEVNIGEVFQREVELAHITRFLRDDMRVLEVGCGNGFTTSRLRERVASVDAFDFSEEMVDRAKGAFGETNNRFFHDSIVEPRHLDTGYDVVVCVRVLINLRSQEEQLRAIANLAHVLDPGGTLILVEGFADGFEALSALRSEIDLPPVQPASINLYVPVAEIRAELERYFEVRETFHLGAYDYLTRVVHPSLVRPEEPQVNSVFTERASQLAIAWNPDAFEPLARVRGFVLEKRA